MATTSDDILSALKEHLRATREPVATTTDLVDRVEVVRRTVLSRLEVLEARGDVASKDVGRGRVWWPVDDRPFDPPSEPSTDPVDPPTDLPSDPPSTTAGAATMAESPPADPPSEPSPEPSSEPPAETDDLLEHIVDDVAREWDRDADNFQQRREASLVALQWLREERGPASASDVKAALLERHGVPGQSPDAWWRTTVRPAFQKAVDRDLAEYQHGPHEYRWISLEN